jgi:hypothetical protein
LYELVWWIQLDYWIKEANSRLICNLLLVLSFLKDRFPSFLIEMVLLVIYVKVERVCTIFTCIILDLFLSLGWLT